MSDLTRFYVDIPQPLSEDRAGEVLRLLQTALGAEGLGKFEVRQREMATASQIEEARGLSKVDDDLEVDDDAETSMGADNGYFISAWLWVPDGERRVTLERLQELAEMEWPHWPEGMEEITPEYLQGFLAWYQAEYAPDHNMGSADLEIEIERYNATLQHTEEESA